MGANVFETVKQSVTVREAAERYGIEVKRGGMACCPFHDDKNPSMKLNEEYFYCFGCGATGDVIDLTARLYNLSPKEAAEKLAQDFGLIYDSQAGSGGLLPSSPQVGSGLHTQNTGGTHAPPFFRGGAAKGLYRLSAGFFSGGQPGGTKAMDR